MRTVLVSEPLATGRVDRVSVLDERRPLVGRRRRRSRVGLRRSLVLVGVLALAGAGGALAARQTRAFDAEEAAVSVPAAAAPPPRPTWLDINRPIQLFGLSGSDFARLPLVYGARRRDPTGERRDLLVYGAFDGKTPFLGLSILRWAGNTPAEGDLFVNVARLAADTGLAVARNGLPASLETRFGVFEAADISLSKIEGASAIPCVGFRLVPSTPPAPVGIAGVACRPGAKPLQPAALACVLNRIDLLSAGDDEALQGFFVEAERRRGEDCATPTPVAAGGRRALAGADVPRHVPGSRIR